MKSEEYQSHEQQGQYHEPVMPHSGNHGSTVVSVMLAIVVVGLVIYGTITASGQIAQAAVILTYVMVGLAVIIIPGLVIYLMWHKWWYMYRIKRQHAALDAEAKQVEIEAKADETRRASEAHEMNMHIAQTRLYPDALGNRPFIFNPRTYEIIEVRSGNYIQAVPNHLHYEYNYSDTSTRASEEKQAQIAGVQAPTMEYIISQLRYNALQVCLGISLETGKPHVMDLIEGTHYRIIGGSGFGKSCEAAAILEQVTQTNDPDHLLVALLDLEHKTSKLFEDLPHIAELSVGRKRIECLATNPDEVARHFGILRAELDRRKALSEYDLERERFMLIYVEEFLSLRREVDPDLLEQMMKDFSILALRGRKYGLYLLACAQVDYSDKSLREAMNQFNVNMSFSVKPSAARAAGFASNELLKQNFEAKQIGQFVLETTGCTDIFLAPHYDLKAKLRQLEGAKRNNNVGAGRVLDSTISDASTYSAPQVAPVPAPAWEAYVEPIKELRARGFNQDEIIEKLWSAKKGSNQKYQDAREVYRKIIVSLDESEA